MLKSSDCVLDKHDIKKFPHIDSTNVLYFVLGTGARLDLQKTAFVCFVAFLRIYMCVCVSLLPLVW